MLSRIVINQIPVSALAIGVSGDGLNFQAISTVRQSYRNEPHEGLTGAGALIDARLRMVTISARWW
jgi:hypothetical protein